MEEPYMTRSGRRRRLVSEPATTVVPTTRRVKVNSGDNSKYSTVILVRPNPITKIVKNSSSKPLAASKNAQNVSTSNSSSTITPLLPNKTQSLSTMPIVRSLDSGISLGGYVYESTESASTSRSSTSNSKMSTPSGSKRSSPTTTKLRAVPINILQTQRNRESPTERQLYLTSDSPNSFNARELPISVSFNDNLTTLPSSLHGGMGSNHTGSAARPIPSGGSSGNSLQSGSPNGPIGIPIANSAAFRQVVSSSAPTSSFDMEAFVRGGRGGSNSSNQSHADNDFYRDRRKKDIHNMIERRRRYNINDRIKELGLMLPKSTAEEMKLNKGTILKASCDYIRQLQQDRDVMLKQQQEKQRLEEAAKLYAKRIKELEEHLQKNGVVVPEGTSVPPLSSITTETTKSHVRPIKQEPYDEPLSPSQTPTGSYTSSGFMNQMQEMQIASPGGYHQGNGPMVGSLPADSSFGHYHPRHNFFPSSSPITTPQASSNHGSLSEYGTPNSAWSPLAGSLQQSMLQNNSFDFVMEDLSSQDPMLGGSNLVSQMSPEIQWDQAGFSPESQQLKSNASHSLSIDY
uniref:BHLH domain-containing protein n=1 Tax=Panagrolaimus sp. JU765 TaxID=591449 RepID=A0AC34Q2H8_9BILA